MQSVGRHVVARLLTVFTLPIGVLFVWLDYAYGLPGVIAALGVSGTFLATFFIGLWDKVKDPLTKRLDYLNQQAFATLFEWSNSNQDWRISPNLDSFSKALSALRAHRTYLTAGLYPKKLLQLTEWTVQNTPQYDELWTEAEKANRQWIQEHLSLWGHIAQNPDMNALLSALGIKVRGFPVRPEVAALLPPFVVFYRQNNPDSATRFVTLTKDFQEKQHDMSVLLGSYMSTNMMHKSPLSGYPA